MTARGHAGLLSMTSVADRRLPWVVPRCAAGQRIAAAASERAASFRLRRY
jgi:hypothetical protein